MNGLDRAKEDLRYVFGCVPLKCLRHLRTQHHRLTRRAYVTAGGRGCLMYLLTELLPEGTRIDSRAALKRFFSPSEDAGHPDYQPARWLVRLWDGCVCPGLRARYGDCTHLSKSTVLTVLDEATRERERIEREARAVERAALARLRARTQCTT